MKLFVAFFKYRKKRPITNHVFYKSNQDSLFEAFAPQKTKSRYKGARVTLNLPNRRLTQRQISGNQSTVSSWGRVGVMNSGCH